MSFPRKWESSLFNMLQKSLDSRLHGNDDFCNWLYIIILIKEVRKSAISIPAQSRQKLLDFSQSARLAFFAPASQGGSGLFHVFFQDFRKLVFIASHCRPDCTLTGSLHSRCALITEQKIHPFNRHLLIWKIFGYRYRVKNRLSCKSNSFTRFGALYADFSLGIKAFKLGAR